MLDYTEKTYNYVLFVSLTIIFIILELVAMKLSYENYGWFEMCVIFIAIFINILPILFFIFNKKSVAIIILTLLFLLIVPVQLYFTNMRLKLKEEGANIVCYAYQSKLNTGNFPTNISAYKFVYPKLKNHFFYNNKKDKAFTVSYYVGTTSTSHYYSHERGRWEYYDD